jgi:isopenicillin-N N-acyltransferase-like protein
MGVRELPRITAVGTRRVVGRRHGAACRAEIRAFRDSVLGHLERFGGMSVATGLARAERLFAHVARGLPALAEEVRGIADGAGLSVAEAALLQVRYEVANLPASAEGCTLIGVEASRSRSGQSMVAQNIDVPADNVPLLILLEARPDDAPALLTCTFAGILAQTGINAAGLGLCGSFVVSATWGAGIPARNFIRRHILEQASLADAMAVMRRFPIRASGHNVMLTDRSGRVIDIESTPESFRVLEAGDGLLAHTNHYCHPDLAPHDTLATSSLADFAEDSPRRVSRVWALARAVPGPLGVDDIQGLLRDHADYPKSVCRHPDGDPTRTQSACSVVLTPGAGSMTVAVGTPCDHPATEYAL